MNELYTALIAAAVAALGYLFTYLTNKKLKDRVITLEEFIASDDTEYYVECPICKSQIVLNKVKILVNKEKDKNL